MGGCPVDEDWEFASVTGVRTLLLVGRTGNGKSATGNSILSKKAFVSMPSPGGVTSTCMLQSTVLEDDLTLNVIDTPGLFDYSDEPEFAGKEIVRCIDMAKDGIHAVLVVLSTSSRFTGEEEAAIMSLQNFIGPKISAYMVVVFTGGDGLEVNGVTLDDYLGCKCPRPLKELLDKCGNRSVLFDNQTRDGDRRAKQLKELLFLVDEVVRINGGKPFTNEIFAELKKVEEKRCDQPLKVDSLQGLSNELQMSHDELMNRITMMVEEKLKVTILRLEQQLAEERAAWLKAEENAAKGQKISMEEVCTMRENLKKAEKRSKELAAAAQKISMEDMLRENIKKAEKITEELAAAAQKISMEGVHMLRENLKKAEKITEELAAAAQKLSMEGVHMLRENLKEAKKRSKELTAAAKNGGCAIL